MQIINTVKRIKRILSKRRTCNPKHCNPKEQCQRCSEYNFKVLHPKYDTLAIKIQGRYIFAKINVTSTYINISARFPDEGALKNTRFLYDDETNEAYQRFHLKFYNPHEIAATVHDFLLGIEERRQAWARNS